MYTQAQAREIALELCKITVDSNALNYGDRERVAADRKEWNDRFNQFLIDVENGVPFKGDSKEMYNLAFLAFSDTHRILYSEEELVSMFNNCLQALLMQDYNTNED